MTQASTTRTTATRSLTERIAADPALAYPDVPVEFSTVPSVGGAALSVRSHGPIDGDVIVFAHGWTMNSDFWRAQINDLAGEFRVICYDQRGHGASTMGSEPFRQDLLGRDLNAVLNAVVPQGRKAILVGHSMGGMTIMSWARLYHDEVPERARAVVLCSTASGKLLPEPRFEPLRPAGWMRAAELVVMRAVMSNEYWFPGGELGRRRLRLALGTIADDAHVAFTEELSAACSQRTRGRWGGALLDLDVAEGLDRLSIPVTVVVGDEDRLTSKRHAAQIAKRLGETGALDQLVVMPGSGHQLPIERHKEFDALLREIIAR